MSVLSITQTKLRTNNSLYLLYRHLMQPQKSAPIQQRKRKTRHYAHLSRWNLTRIITVSGRCCWIFCIHATFHRTDRHLLENWPLNPALQQNCSISHLFLNETTGGRADPPANELHIRDSSDGSWDRFNFAAVHITLQLPITSHGDRQHQREHNELHNSRSHTVIRHQHDYSQLHNLASHNGFCYVNSVRTQPPAAQPSQVSRQHRWDLVRISET